MKYVTWADLLKSGRCVWEDERGYVVSAELVLISTLLGVGMITGLVSVRNQINQELVDVGQAIGSLSQSYAYGGISKPGMAYTDGSYYNDVCDFCQTSRQVPGCEPGGIVIAGNYPCGAPLAPPNGEQGRLKPAAPCGCADGEPTPATWVFRSLEGYPANVVRVVTLGVPKVRFADDVKDSQAKLCSLDFELSVSVDTARYEQFQAQLVRQLDGLAIRKGDWTAQTEVVPGKASAGETSLPPGSKYDGLRQLKQGQAFAAGNWGTDQADLAKETVMLVNTHRDPKQGTTSWAWYNLRRPGNSVRNALQVKIDYLGSDGRSLAQDLVPINVGYNACPPGLDVFDLVSRRDGDMRTLFTFGAKNPDAMTAAVQARTQNPAHHAEDLLVVVSPFFSLGNGGEPPQTFADNLVLPITRKFTRAEAKKFAEVRCTLVAFAGQ